MVMKDFGRKTNLLGCIMYQWLTTKQSPYLILAAMYCTKDRYSTTLPYNHTEFGTLLNSFNCNFVDRSTSVRHWVFGQEAYVVDAPHTAVQSSVIQNQNDRDPSKRGRAMLLSPLVQLNRNSCVTYDGKALDMSYVSVDKDYHLTQVVTVPESGLVHLAFVESDMNTRLTSVNIGDCETGKCLVYP
jgi:hypothetical protein